MRQALLHALLYVSFPLFLFGQPTAIKAGKVLDPKTGNMLLNQIILVEDGRIVATGSNTVIPRNATVIDLSSKTVLPGLIDCHTHELLQPEDERGFPPVISKSQAFRTIQSVAGAKKDLEAGFTTMRDLDSEGAGFADVALRDAINKGIVPGPRLFVSTLSLTITAGHMNNAGLNPEQVQYVTAHGTS
ncbi:MAG: amidohydrolase family protein, partial [Bacteroidota bacterium]